MVKAQVYVATVGRLIECVEREYIRVEGTECLVIDEADKFPKSVTKEDEG